MKSSLIIFGILAAAATIAVFAGKSSTVKLTWNSKGLNSTSTQLILIEQTKTNPVSYTFVKFLGIVPNTGSYNLKLTKSDIGTNRYIEFGCPTISKGGCPTIPIVKLQ